MILSKKGNMFTETSVCDNAGEIKDAPSVIDLDYAIGELSLSPIPYEGSYLRADESFMSMVKLDVSGADLHSTLDSISFDLDPEKRDDVAKETIRADAFDFIDTADLNGQRPDLGKNTSKCNILASELSTQMVGEAEVLGEIDVTHELSHPLIVNTPSSTSAHSYKSIQNNESRKTRRTATKKSVLDLSSLQFTRRRRSLLPKQGRSSVWGSLGDTLPDFEERSGPIKNLGNVKKPRRTKGVQRNRNAIKDKKDRKSIGNSCTPAGHISLKIKIGNQSCTIGNVARSSSASRKSIPELFDNTENKVGEEVLADMVSPCDRNLEKMMSSDASVLSTNVAVRGFAEKPSFITSSHHHQTISQVEGDNLGVSSENRCSDPGTSPDSEVINSVPDALLLENCLQNMQESPVISKACASLANVSSFTLPHMKSKKGKKKDKLHQLGNSSVVSKLTDAETTKNAKVDADLVPGQIVDDVFYCTEASTITTAKKHLETHCRNGVPKGPTLFSRVNESEIPSSTGAEMNPSPGLVAATTESSISQVCETFIPCSNGKNNTKCFGAKGQSKSRSGILGLPSKKDISSKNKGNNNNLSGERQVNEAVVSIGVIRGVESYPAAGHQASSNFGETGILGKDPISSLHSGVERDNFVPLRNAWVLCDMCEKWRRIPAALADQIEETNGGWTCKDNTDKDFADCSIPQEKSNSEINKELEISDASCEEDACDTSLTSNHKGSKVSPQLSWSLIKSNLFLHRSRKKQTIDEVMVCHCKPPSDGRMGCGAKCLNRMLNIECVRKTCPCGELCSNQQFQKRKYASLELFRCGKKGYGLQALGNILEGQFLIEYVGEVLDVHAYEARQREYAMNGHRHFYFMTLNGSEVIDACAKGNLGRYINHSCDPNCRTEKWMVNGEVCVGLFAVRNIKKGEEVTFDYNYVRVFGAAAKKCVCGSPNCRGYIGGDPTNSEIVQSDSDDEYSEPVVICEDNEMKADWNDIMSNSLIDKKIKIANDPPENRHRMKEQASAVGHLEIIAERHTTETLTQKVEGVNSTSTDVCLKTRITAQAAETMVRDTIEGGNSVGNDSDASAVGKLDIGKDLGESLNESLSVESERLVSQICSSSQLTNISLPSEGTMNKKMSSNKHDCSIGVKSTANSSSSAHGSDFTTISPCKSLPGTVECKRMLKYATVVEKDELAKSNILSKAHRSSSSIKKGKLKSNVVNDKGTSDLNQLNAAPYKLKKQPELPSNSQFEAVEAKLNDLLDPEGGISKRKDASRGYLKLLFLTAASGNNCHGEAIQSNRELSMILDALLKTKSRTVLVDVINKNGLQMLHNIMKQYRKEFIKTPILRKLLKVLEYLAMREILTLKHITGGPACPGVESFKDSILTLTEHADKQVHQIARNFRDRWIPRSLRKYFCMDRDDGRMEFHPRSSFSRLSASHDVWSDRFGKPSEAADPCETESAAASGTAETSTLDHSALGTSRGTNGTRTRKRKSRWDIPLEESQHSRFRTNLEDDGKPNIDEDFPPGFSPPCNGLMVPSDGSSNASSHQQRNVCTKHPFDIVLGNSQQKFIACMPVSYGVPSSVMRQFGDLQAETAAVWTIAPGVPFYPFPPLPPYAHDKGNPPASAAGYGSLSEPAGKVEQGRDSCITHYTGQKHTRTWSVDPQEMNVSDANDRLEFQRGGGSYSSGRRHFKQQKSNHSKLAPPWVRMRNGWGYNAGNNPINGVPGVGIGNGANEFRNSYNSEEVNWRG
ncbi:hypothetical protein ACJIZ3_002894 [Penstemon smallii]|uniref:Histone-lysine N-methyltransferase ASHH2 n=1 Tax=Penstemon smallii TaxID=265156 RepID=A0ABD3U9K1_9LAMI